MLVIINNFSCFIFYLLYLHGFTDYLIFSECLLLSIFASFCITFPSLPILLCLLPIAFLCLSYILSCLVKSPVPVASLYLVYSVFLLLSIPFICKPYLPCLLSLCSPAQPVVLCLLSAHVPSTSYLNSTFAFEPRVYHLL